MSAAPAERWATWVRRLRDAEAAGSWRRELPVLAEEISAVVGTEGSLVQRWARAGVEVSIKSMWARGRCDVSNPRPRVFVKRRANEFAQNFTAAHEVAHLLLHSLPSRALAPIELRAEERLCDGFARDVVVPQARLAELLRDDDAPSVNSVLRLCGSFGANPSVVLAALGQRGGLWDTAYLLARWRGHYRRPAVVDFRIDASVGPDDLFWPRGRRVRKLGFAQLAESASKVAHGTHFEGGDAWVVVPRRRLDESGHNAMAGPVRWQAVRQGRDEPYLLARIDCSGLEGIRLTGAPEGEDPVAAGPRDAAVDPAAPRELALPGLARRR